MGKIFALDIGEARIGIASSDELGILVTPYGFIERKNAINKLIEIFKQEDCNLVVIGMPFLPSGTLGSQAKDVESFIDEFKNKININFVTENEVLTSKEAENRLRTLGQKRPDKGEIDAMAATIILEQYLGRRSNGHV